MTHEALWQLGMESLRSLESDRGILASGRTEAYGCLFGRDALITSLGLLRAYRKTPDPYFLQLVERSLRTLANLQGRYEVLQSGEEPGKIVHEYRPSGHEHLTQLAENPWYVYPEGVMRNYDSVDSTPLFLLAVYEYAQVGDSRIVTTLMPAVNAALTWLMRFDTFVTYEFKTNRTHGGLAVQSWMDSSESLFYEASDARPPYPVAPVEVQAYAWKALSVWGHHERAALLKKKFNDSFVLRRGDSVSLAYALDGNLQPLVSPRSSMGHVLWASVPQAQGLYLAESILEAKYVPALRRRLLAPDLFVPGAGLRTLSARSRAYNPMSYHNGSIWPHDSAMVADGLDNFGAAEDAARIRAALLRAYAHFKTPLELYSWRRGLREYESASGHKACRVQAWSTAALLGSLQ